VNRDEGLFILNTAGNEEGVTDIIEKVRSEIGAAGGKVETVQKMDKRSFVRVSDNRVTGGHYVNIIFEAGPKAIAQLQARLQHSADVYRTLFSEASKAVVAQ